MLHEIEREAFESLKGTRLKVTGNGRETEMLVRETELVGGYTQRPKPPFRVELGAPLDCPLRQGVFEVEHPALGRLDLFITCIGPDADGMRYEAVFN